MREARAEKEPMTNEETTTTVAEHGAPVAPAKPSSKKGATPKKSAPKAKKTAKAAKPAKPAKKAPTPATERNHKKAEVIAMMKRAKGVTLAEIMEATGWQKHTVRGFVSILGSKGGETIESSKRSRGEDVQNREAARPSFPTNAALGTPAGAAFLLDAVSRRRLSYPRPVIRVVNKSRCPV